MKTDEERSLIQDIISILLRQCEIRWLQTGHVQQERPIWSVAARCLHARDNTPQFVLS